VRHAKACVEQFGKRGFEWFGRSVRFVVFSPEGRALFAMV
jgi:hypothetical protein